MDNDHGITGELREWFKDRIFMANGWQELHDIADRIDAEHERAMAAAALIAGVPATDEDMAELGWVRLPVDGEAPCKQLGEWIEKRGLITGPLDHDGELWHKGDMSASPWGEIESIVFDGQCWQVCGHDTSAPWLPADSLLHYHAPTVEDVLREFASECLTYATCVDDHEVADAIELYAAKLQLRGDAE